MTAAIDRSPEAHVFFDTRRLNVRGLEAIDGTPVIDIKPVLDRCDDS
jgi:tRNA (Thr-GGU) A37 N-methylase